MTYCPTANLLCQLILAAGFFSAAASPRVHAEAPAFWRWAAKPPMGWNSYDAFGDSVTEAEVMTNARALQQTLLAHGYNTVVIDYRWYDPGAHSSDLKDRDGAPLAMDRWGRLLPAPNRFPSASGGQGFKPLADRIHAMGMKFGIHVMRGIPRRAVAANLPIEGSQFHASDAGDRDDICTWNPDMFGVKGSEAPGQAWYDSVLRLYAEWGVDYIKVDDLSNPYSIHEIEAIRRAIDRCGRSIVFSLSPGPTPLSRGGHVENNANLWRISGDFWDKWDLLEEHFDMMDAWSRYGGPGHWPDADMIPFGHISIRCWDGGKDRWTRFTHDEQKTLMTLWSLASSPLMLGMNLPDNDAWTQSVIANDEVLAIDQDALGHPGQRVLQYANGDIWIKELSHGDKAVGFLNRGLEPNPIVFKWGYADLRGKYLARDLWRHAELGTFGGKVPVTVPPHGAVLIRLRAAGGEQPGQK